LVGAEHAHCDIMVKGDGWREFIVDTHVWILMTIWIS